VRKKRQVAHSSGRWPAHQPRRITMSHEKLWQVARSSAPKNHHESWEAVPRSLRSYRDERAGAPGLVLRSGNHEPQPVGFF
jgi:hypothetical protein